MFVKQLSLFIENHKGALSAVFRVLRQEQINIRTLSLADTQEFGILRMLTQDTEKAKTVLEKAGFVVKTTEVAALFVPDRSGGLADTLDIFDRHGLSVEYMYAIPGRDAGRAIIVLRFGNPERAMAELKQESLEFADQDQLFD